jgi:hypothetical protein
MDRSAPDDDFSKTMLNKLAGVALQETVCDYLKQAGIQSRKVYFSAPFFLSVLGRAQNT